MSGNETKGVNVAASAPYAPVDLGAAAGRDRQRLALAALFEAEFSRIYGFVYARCGSTTLAEDVAAETFVDAARAVNAGQGADVSRSWLFMVARRRLVDRWRSDERHRRRLEKMRLLRSPEAEVIELGIGGDGSGKQIDDERVLEALAALPTRQRAALTLRYLDEFSVPEIADALDVSYRAAESLLSRARAGFAKAYGDDSDG